MTKHLVLNNQDHLSLKVQPMFNDQLGHQVGQVVVLPNEIDPLHVEFPLLFKQSAEGQGFHCVALLGFEANENLFLENGQWTASQLPLLFAKGPFLIGRQQDETEQESAVLLIDRDDPRVNEENGFPLFLEFGGNSPFLTNMQSVLQKVDQGLQLSDQFIGVLKYLDLLEPAALQIGINEQLNVRLEGYFTINQKRLHELDDENLIKLQRSGNLTLIHLIIGSLSNMAKLVAIKQRKVA